MPKKLSTPLTGEAIEELHAGDEVLITGTIYVARDAAHQRLIAALDAGEELPFDPRGQIIYYMGPSPARPGRPIGAAGPTTSYRMDPYTPRLLEQGVKGLIGKGSRGPEVRAALQRHRAVYLAATGGAAALIADSIKEAQVIAYEDLGAEALRKLWVQDFPAIVINDVHGRDAYEEGKSRYRIGGDTSEMIETSQLTAIVQRALAEDVGQGDVTSQWTLPPGLWGRGVFLCKAEGILAGMAVAREVFAQVSADVRLDARKSDGDPIALGERIATVSGPMAAILTAERTALNFVQRMSGIATATRRYVDAVAGTRAIILDTRKTAPGLRLLDKWAVRLGGGRNNRVGLYDMVLIKDNHIAAAGGITAAVERVRAQNALGLPIEVEVKTWAELEEAVALRPDRIMLDNMTPDQMRRAVAWVAGRVPLEASGGINLDTVRAVAETGVDYISVGALTHSVTALDISLEVSGRD